MKNRNRILVMMTGGTICSVKSSDGKSRSKASVTQSYLADHYRESDSPFARQAEFDYRRLTPDVLSENINTSVLLELLDLFKEDALEERYAGVIVLHGTDTLAYTSAFLSFALAGLRIPVLMVSSQLPLRTETGETETRANGYANFRAAVELILNGILPNVYAVYQNEPKANEDQGELLLHFGAHLLQCPNVSDDFHSRDEMKIPDPKNARLAGVSFESSPRYYREVLKGDENVLLLLPHTNLDYRLFDLSSCRAVIHGTYHSESVCIGRPCAHAEKNDVYTLDMLKEEDKPYSILYLLEKCNSQGIPLFLAPCCPESYRYGTTLNALERGAHPLGSMTLESAYMKALLGCMIGKRAQALVSFMGESINGEFVSHEAKEYAAAFSAFFEKRY